jgi:hypothetical protein
MQNRGDRAAGRKRAAGHRGHAALPRSEAVGADATPSTDACHGRVPGRSASPLNSLIRALRTAPFLDDYASPRQSALALTRVSSFSQSIQSRDT